MAASKKVVNQTETEETVAQQNDLEKYIVAENVRREQLANIIAELQNSLNEPFPPDVERELKKSGTYLTYIPVSEVINRLNKVLGFNNWSYEIISCERDPYDKDFVLAHVRLTATPDGSYDKITRDGFGGQKIKRTKAGEIVDLGDEFKGAVSDALKKAAQSLGVGLYLARTEEAMEYDTQSSAPQQPSRVEDPALEALWTSFVSVSKSLDADAKALLNDFWVEYSGGRPKPTRETATVDDIESLIAEATKLYMDAKTING